MQSEPQIGTEHSEFYIFSIAFCACPVLEKGIEVLLCMDMVLEFLLDYLVKDKGIGKGFDASRRPLWLGNCARVLLYDNVEHGTCNGTLRHSLYAG
ncbi:22882_t:CDS:2 [Gigaspora rosea]|nr:22882_t:CDS:2 [Gigaspora rosea]